MDRIVSLDFYATLVCMAGILLLGRFIIAKVRLLQDYSIPEPVVGGIIAAWVLLGLEVFCHIQVSFDISMKSTLMLAFFSSIGLCADFASLKKGGVMLIRFLFIVTGLLLVQNIAGILIAKGMGVNPLMGMLGGSISMNGGHGTGATWASIFEHAPFNYPDAMMIAMAAATFGLISGGIIGGPVAKYLIKRHSLKPQVDNASFSAPMLEAEFEAPKDGRVINANSLIESVALIALCLLVGSFLYGYAKAHFDKSFVLPEFVWCLFVGVIVRNLLTGFKIRSIFDREISVIGNFSLSLFLAIALTTVNIKQLWHLALPLSVILTVQVVLMALYAVLVTFRAMGRDYDAAVLAGGHCGFGLGATPTAIVNMQTITSKYGPSHTAFLVVPMVGAFFIDIINALVISGFLKLPIF